MSAARKSGDDVGTFCYLRMAVPGTAPPVHLEQPHVFGGMRIVTAEALSPVTGACTGLLPRTASSRRHLTHSSGTGAASPWPRVLPGYCAAPYSRRAGPWQMCAPICTAACTTAGTRRGWHLRASRRSAMPRSAPAPCGASAERKKQEQASLDRFFRSVSISVPRFMIPAPRLAMPIAFPPACGLAASIGQRTVTTFPWQSEVTARRRSCPTRCPADRRWFHSGSRPTY